MNLAVIQRPRLIRIITARSIRRQMINLRILSQRHHTRITRLHTEHVFTHTRVRLLRFRQQRPLQRCQRRTNNRVPIQRVQIHRFIP